MRRSRRESIDRRFWFLHESGRRLYPYRSVEQATGRWTFRVAPPGTGANRVENQTLLDDVEDVHRYVFQRGWSVRLCAENGSNEGLYNKGGYSIHGTSEDGPPSEPTTADYAMAIASGTGPEIARDFLVAHHAAPGYRASMLQLARATGHDDHNWANLQYGSFAARVAKRLPALPADVRPDSDRMHVLAIGERQGDAFGHFTWTLRPPVVAALEQLGWVERSARADTAPQPQPGDVVEDLQTTRERIVETRMGQALFRSRVVDYWQGCCAVTGCSLKEVLVASHIHPWAESSSAERLDGFNGLLLTPNLDRLFDKHLISFAGDGTLLVAPVISATERTCLGLDRPSRIARLNEHHLRYLERHRQRFLDSISPTVGTHLNSTTIEAQE